MWPFSLNFGTIETLTKNGTLPISITRQRFSPIQGLCSLIIKKLQQTKETINAPSLQLFGRRYLLPYWKCWNILLFSVYS